MPRVVFLLAVVWLALGIRPAVATEATPRQVQELAHDADFDEDARRRLLAVEEIDGRPVDMERLLAGAEGDEFEQRVEALLSQRFGAGDPRDPAADRAAAKEILQQDRYRPDEIPRPFRGPLEWIADRLAPVTDAISSFFEWIARLFSTVAGGTPGGAATLWMLLGLGIVALVAWQTKRVVERRSRRRPEEAAEDSPLRADDPRSLERQAAAAHARGDHELAVRLLFRAGLLRLARARTIPPRSSLTTGQLRRLISLPEFDALGSSFDEIAYGRRPATEADSSAARSGWSEVLRKASV